MDSLFDDQMMAGMKTKKEIRVIITSARIFSVYSIHTLARSSWLLVCIQVSERSERKDMFVIDRYPRAGWLCMLCWITYLVRHCDGGNCMRELCMHVGFNYSLVLTELLCSAPRVTYIHTYMHACIHRLGGRGGGSLLVIIIIWVI